MNRLQSFGVVTSLALLTSGAAFANDSSYGGCSGLPSGVSRGQECVPIENHVIALVDEKLDITATYHLTKVVARYTFTNTGDETTITIGFPLYRPFGEEDGPQGSTPEAAFPDYEVLVDGEKAAHTSFSPAEQGGPEAKRAASSFQYNAVFLVDVPFKKGQSRVLEHRYSTGTSLVAFAYTPVRYILKTGANWKGGTIGQIAISVSVDEPTSTQCLRASLPGTKWNQDARRFEFTAKNWKPTRDLAVTYSPSEVQAQLSFASREGVLSSVTSDEATDDAVRAQVEGASTNELLSAYHELLVIFHVRAPSRGGKGESLCDEELAVLKTTWRSDPNITLATLPKWASRFLRTADASLTARKVTHQALPPA